MKVLGVLLLALPLGAQVSVTRLRDAVRIDVNGKPFTSFVYGAEQRKPYFAELRSASGAAVTRGVPASAEAGESVDHPHQKGLYFAHGDVDGYNYWATEPSQVVATTGSTVARSVAATKDGFTAELEMLDPSGAPVVEQSIAVAVSAEGALRILDFDARLRGIRKSTFRDSTEGIFALRVASWMEPNRSGRMRCPAGEGERDCWGRRAPWIDFSGVKGGETLGIAVLQHPSSLRYPTYWHARAYGLLAANPFGAQHFYDERVKKGWDTAAARPPAGDFALEPGQEARFRYRVVVHSGAVDVDALFRKYAAAETVFDRLPAARAMAFNEMGALYEATDRGVVQVFGAAASEALTPGAVSSLAFEANGDLIAAGREGFVRISQTGEVRPIETACSGAPAAVAVSPAGAWAATDAAVCRVGGGVATDAIPGIRALTVSGDRLLAGDGAGRVWQVVPGEPRIVAKAGGSIAALAADVAGNVYAASGAEIAVFARNGAAVNRFAMPAAITGMAFGAADRWSLWAGDVNGRIHRIPAPQPGAPAVWSMPKRLRIVSPADGDILNRRDGIAVEGGLRITVRGEVDGNAAVTVNGVKIEPRDGRFATEITLTGRETRIVAQRGGLRDEAIVYWDTATVLRYRMSVDDNIEWLKDLALHTPSYRSIFDNPYLAMWRELHRKYGARAHFNIYYETRGFNLTEMPDRYREEFRRNADWIRLSFHARANDPDRPYVHSTAKRIAEDYGLVNREIERFAGREVMSPATTIHWGEASTHAIGALRAAGVKAMAGYFELRRDLPGVSYDLTMAQVQHLSGRDYWMDTKRGLLFTRHDIVLNDAGLDIPKRLETLVADPHQSELIELMIHEEHYYPGWPGYRADYAQRLEQALRWVTERGYRPVFLEELGL